MTDAAGAGSSAGGFLEGLLEGGQAGYGFREGIKTRRRAQKLQADLLTLRQQENERQAAEAGRQQTTFDEQQLAYRRAEALRTEVAGHLAQPMHFKTLGQYISGQPGEHGGPPLSAEARTAQQVGRTLGELGERDLTDDQALLVGSGRVPASAISPKAYHPHSRAEWLDNLRLAAGIRGTGTKLPITMDHAFTVLDRIYTVQDPRTGAWVSKLKPGQRLAIAKKMVAGNVQPADFPDIEDEAPAAGPTAAPRGKRNFLQRVGDLFTGGPDEPQAAAPAAPGVQPPDQQAPSSPQGRVEEARQLLSSPDYQDLDPEQVAQVLRELGYSEEEIADIIGSP